MEEALYNYIIENLPLANGRLSRSYYYSGLPICIIDAVYSIGVRYKGVQNVVNNFCTYANISQYRDHGTPFSEANEQYQVSQLVNFFNDHDIEYITDNIFQNRQRTSTRGGILKSEAVKEFALVLQNFRIETFQDFENSEQLNEIRTGVMQIPGQRSGISFKYFKMLAGNDYLIKPDRMIHRFVIRATGNEQITLGQAEVLILSVVPIIQEIHPHITARLLDHLIWNYERNQND